ncbi:MAG: hypothetical protein ACREM8_12415, partial [Vulcanimicrobiaceae bacterium]
MRRIALALIVAGSVAVAALWALRVPFFAVPDEEAHLDYAFALVDLGGLRPLPGAIPATEVTPQVRDLARIVGHRAMEFNIDARVPPGYGTLAYFRSKAAPEPVGGVADLGPHRPFPYVAYAYPIGAYAAFAAAIALTLAIGHSLVASAFAARFLCVALLVPA